MESEPYEISREDLYEQVWTTPINHLAEKFGVSGSYLARVCSALNVPRPPAGYWQKKAVGKAAPRPELPVALPGDQLSWAKDKPLAPPVKKRVWRTVNRKAATKPIRLARHPLLIGVEEHFRKSLRPKRTNSSGPTSSSCRTLSRQKPISFALSIWPPTSTPRSTERVVAS